MADITAVVLTKNEEKNIAACINSIRGITRRIVIVDSYSTDCTVSIASSMEAEILQHEFVNQAQQYIWAMSQLEIKTEWVLRLDADERISPQAAQEIEQLCAEVDSSVTGIVVPFTVEFMGKRLYHGGIYPFKKMILYRAGHAEMENRAMDEHIVLLDGHTIELKNDSFHHDYKDLTEWINKHNKYSSREVTDYLENICGKEENGRGLQGKARFKRWFKFNVYYKLPIGTRAHLYYWYRYYLKCGFLDGKEGKIFCFLQAYWYRFLVDAKIYESELKSKEKLHEKNPDSYGQISSGS